jgi:hypothetical protein
MPEPSPESGLLTPLLVKPPVKPRRTSTCQLLIRLHIPASLPRLGQIGDSGAKDNHWDCTRQPNGQR